VIDRFFELADPEKSTWITKAKLRKFFRNNLTAKDQIKILEYNFPMLWTFINRNKIKHGRLKKIHFLSVIKGQYGDIFK
jgi:hypothetical protein